MNYRLRPHPQMPRIYLYLEPVDFRKSYRGLTRLFHRMLPVAALHEANAETVLAAADLGEEVQPGIEGNPDHLHRSLGVQALLVDASGGHHPAGHVAVAQQPQQQFHGILDHGDLLSPAVELIEMFAMRQVPPLSG